MTEKNFQKIKDAGYEALSESLLWSQLSDLQKQRVILNHMRKLDAEIFLQESESFEQPALIIRSLISSS